MAQCISLSLFRFDTLTARVWVLGQMALARMAFARMPQAEFVKLCGSGTGEGFTPRPNTAVWAILTGWPDAETAHRNVTTAPVYQRWRAHAAQDWTVLLEPTSVRGEWGGTQPFHVPQTHATPCPAHSVDTAPPSGPIAVLTRASVKPRAALRFWNRVPDISAVIGSDPNVLFKIGIGEVPFLHQVTFSIWPDAQSMACFARGDGPHGRAIRAVRDGDWFREELYARFRLIGETGHWAGMRPLGPPQPQTEAAPWPSAVRQDAAYQTSSLPPPPTADAAPIVAPTLPHTSARPLWALPA